MAHTYIQGLVILFLFGVIHILNTTNMAAQPKGLSICVDKSKIYTDTSKIRYDRFYIESRIENIGLLNPKTGYIDYNVKVFDTTCLITVFYKNGFSVTLDHLYDSLMHEIKIKKTNNTTICDMYIIKQYFNLLYQNANVLKKYKENTFAGVYKICKDTLITQDMFNGNRTFMTFNAFETFYNIRENHTLVELGTHSIKGNYPIRWINEKNQKSYTFVPCDILPPLDTWLQEKKWIYCNPKNRKRKCACN